MALALQMFSAIEHGLAAGETVTTAVPDERWAWVALALVPEVGGNARRYQDLLRLGPPAEVFRSSSRALGTAVGEAAATAITGFGWRRVAQQQAALAARCGARLVLLDDPEYPPLLRPIELPPPFLLVRGELLPD